MLGVVSDPKDDSSRAARTSRFRDDARVTDTTRVDAAAETVWQRQSRNLRRQSVHRLGGVFTTVATAVVGYGAAERYEYLQLEYTRTADQLERIKAGYVAGDPDAAERLIQESERVISISNEGWMAKIPPAEAD
jgi:hypothetical protein